MASREDSADKVSAFADSDARGDLANALLADDGDEDPRGCLENTSSNSVGLLFSSLQ